jgi:hypothetical protein
MVFLSTPCNSIVPPPIQFACPAPAEPRQYVVNLRVVDKSCANSVEGTRWPKITLCEGETTTVAIGSPKMDGPGMACHQLELQVCGRDPGLVSVDLAFERKRVEVCGPEARRIRSQKLQCVQMVKLEQPTSVVLCEGCAECGRCAVEVTVKEAPRPMATPIACPPMPVYVPCIPPPPPPACAIYPAPCPLPGHLVCPPQMIAPPPVAQPCPERLPMPRCIRPAPSAGFATDRAIQPCTGLVPVPSSPSSHSPGVLIWHEGENQMKVRLGSGLSAACASMVLQGPDTGRIKIMAGKKEIHLCGPTWSAGASHVEMGTTGEITLTGQVYLRDRCVPSTRLKADRLILQLHHDVVKPTKAVGYPSGVR